MQSDPQAPHSIETSQLVMDGTDSLGDRLREVHNFVYANEGIKQYARVTDEVIKLIFAKLASEENLQPLDIALNDAELADGARVAFSKAAEVPAAREIFEAGDSLKLSDAGIAFAMRKLGDRELRRQDSKGVAFQAILGPTLRGELGQFFTPDPVKSLLVALTRPRPGEVSCDPASGSAGLLLEVYDFQPAARLRAAEIDAALARLARLNLFLAGEDQPEVFRLDALQPLADIADQSGGQLGAETCDVIVSNPPFGSKGKVVDPKILSELPHVTAAKKSMAPEILFIERIVQLLRPGGRAGIVLPIGVLSNPSSSHVREFLRSVGRIYATVSLPIETFKPTGNSVQSAALFFEKQSESSSRPYPVFRAISKSAGYDHRGRSTGSSDTRQILLEWDAFRHAFREDFPWAS